MSGSLKRCTGPKSGGRGGAEWDMPPAQCQNEGRLGIHTVALITTFWFSNPPQAHERLDRGGRQLSPS